VSETGSEEWQKLWQEYTKHLENWRQLVESVQKASYEIQQKIQ